MKMKMVFYFIYTICNPNLSQKSSLDTKDDFDMVSLEKILQENPNETIIYTPNTIRLLKALYYNYEGDLLGDNHTQINLDNLFKEMCKKEEGNDVFWTVGLKVKDKRDDYKVKAYIGNFLKINRLQNINEVFEKYYLWKNNRLESYLPLYIEYDLAKYERNYVGYSFFKIKYHKTRFSRTIESHKKNIPNDILRKRFYINTTSKCKFRPWKFKDIKVNIVILPLTPCNLDSEPSRFMVYLIPESVYNDLHYIFKQFIVEFGSNLTHLINKSETELISLTIPERNKFISNFYYPLVSDCQTESSIYTLIDIQYTKMNQLIDINPKQWFKDVKYTICADKPHFSFLYDVKTSEIVLALIDSS